MENNFNPWLENQLQMLISVKTKDELLTGLSEASKLLGFDYFSYGLRSSMPVSAPKIAFVSNYPLHYQQLYLAKNYLDIDPIVHLCMKTTTPVIWEENLFLNARSLWEDCNAAGLHHGWSQSSFLRSGICGMLTLARSNDALTAKELAYRAPILVWFNQLAQVGLSHILLPDMVQASQVKLTARETEIMRWTADGKTACEISMILSVAERTVNFHINNVLSKFNVTSKIAATVQAVLLGVI